MKIGMVGLGRMGAGLTERLLQHGHDVVGYDVDPAAVKRVAALGAGDASSLGDLVALLEPPRAVWVMVPAGEITRATIRDLASRLDSGDTLIDGGNSRYTDSVEHAASVGERGIGWADAGTSGGVWGPSEGFCLMVGAEKETFERLEPIFRSLAPEKGYARVGGPGAGHFVKMVHNGIEYGLMQAYAEGFELLHASEFDLDTGQVADLWMHGSVVRSWLLQLAAAALRRDPELSEVSDHVADSGEGRWTIETAVNNAVPTPVIAAALFKRFASRQDESFSGKVLSALRREFGGHAVGPAAGELDK